MSYVHRVEVLIAFVFAIAIFAAWLGGIVDRWPRRSRHARRIIDTPIVPLHLAAPRARESELSLADLSARAIAGLPTWQIRALFELSDVSLDTHADVSRWMLVLGAIEKRSREVRRLLEAKRDELRLCGETESDLTPDFLRPGSNHGGAP